MNSLPRLAARPGGVTIADVMRIRHCSMRDAIPLLKVAEAKGLVRRTGGEPKTAFRWVTA